MQDADLYFTHTIVGAAVTVTLGRFERYPASHLGAMELDPRSGRSQLAPGWSEWFAARASSQAPVGTPWRRPGKLRRFIARNTMVLALSGWLAALAVGMGWVVAGAPQWIAGALMYVA